MTRFRVYGLSLAVLALFAAPISQAAAGPAVAAHPSVEPRNSPANLALYKFICTPSGNANRHVTIWNTGTGPAPAGVKIHWQMVHPPYKTNERGDYVLTADLPALGSATIPDLRLSRSITCDVPDIDGWSVACVAGVKWLLGACKASVVSH